MTSGNTLSRIPVTIVTGFLGAGKTSLLNHILTAPHGLRIAVLVNDFGAVNIDADLISNRDGEVVSLENGCICCSLSDGLLAAASRILRLPQPPDRIVIETSGVSDPMEVARTFSDPDLQIYAPLDGIVTVVDAEYGPSLDGAEAALARTQLEASDIVLLNKIDLIGADALSVAYDWIKSISPRVKTIETVRAAAPVPLLMDIGGDPLSLLAESAGRSHDHAHPHGAPPFDTALFESGDPIPYARLRAALEAMPRSVFRAKGILYVAEKPDHRLILQATGRRAEITVGELWGDAPRGNRLIVIGKPGEVDADGLKLLLGGHGPVSEAVSIGETHVYEQTVVQ
jgi:G3E family GTPase